MKKIYTFIVFATLMNVAIAQNGATCNTALQEIPNPTCQFHNYVINGTEMWFWFQATSEYVNIEVITTQFGSNAPHVHGITMYSGTCANLVEIASDELAFFSAASRLVIDLDASALVVGDIYYIKLSREANGDEECDKSDCFPVINPASFVICIEEINVFIPVDLQAESPAISHAYYQNRGQLLNTNGTPAMDVKMYTLNTNPAVFIGEGFVSFVQASIDTIPATIDTLHKVTMKLEGMEMIPRVFKTERVPGFVNHFLPHIPRGVTGTKGFSRAVCNDVYPKIDMQFYSNRQGIKFYFVVRPGGDADQITMRIDGATSNSITPTQFGDGLLIETPIGDMVFEKAHVYRIHPTNNNLVPMPSSGDFITLGNNQFKFDIGNYPASWTLVIAVDEGHILAQAPAIDNLELSTYYGGNSLDEFFDETTDANGNLYATGYTTSTNFPDTNAYQGTNAGMDDAVIIKLDNNGIRQYATYYGGSDLDIGNGIVVDDFGNIYIAGHTISGDLPLLNPGGGAYFDNVNDGPGTPFWDEAFIAKFSSDGSSLLWGTLYGGFGDADKAFDISMNKQGEIYIVGLANVNAPLLNPGTGAYFSNAGTGLILKFDTTGVRLWATKYGGSNLSATNIYSCETDASDNLIITGYTNVSANFSLVDLGGGAFFDSTYAGFDDAFIAKFDNNDSLIWSSYVGGDSVDIGRGVAVDGSGNIYITGNTKSNTGFPLFNPGLPSYFEGTYQGQGTGSFYQGDVFIGKFDSLGIVQVLTYYGGSADESGLDITTDSEDNVYVIGVTRSANFSFPAPNLTNAYIQNVHSDGNNVEEDGFLIAFNPNFERLWTTFFGAVGKDLIHCVTAFENSKLYMGGATGSPSNFPLVDLGGGAYYQDILASVAPVPDGFIARFDLSPINPSVDIPETTMDNGFAIFPNPTDGNIIISINSKKQQDIRINIFDIRGKLIYNQHTRIVAGNNSIQINISGISTGIYVIQSAYDGAIINRKLVKF